MCTARLRPKRTVAVPNEGDQRDAPRTPYATASCPSGLHDAGGRGRGNCIRVAGFRSRDRPGSRHWQHHDQRPRIRSRARDEPVWCARRGASGTRRGTHRGLLLPRNDGGGPAAAHDSGRTVKRRHLHDGQWRDQDNGVQRCAQSLGPLPTGAPDLGRRLPAADPVRNDLERCVSRAPASYPGRLLEHRWIRADVPLRRDVRGLPRDRGRGPQRGGSGDGQPSCARQLRAGCRTTRVAVVLGTCGASGAGHRCSHLRTQCG